MQVSASQRKLAQAPDELSTPGSAYREQAAYPPQYQPEAAITQCPAWTTRPLRVDQNQPKNKRKPEGLGRAVHRRAVIVDVTTTVRLDIPRPRDPPL